MVQKDSDPRDELMAEALRPRPVFLVIALIFSVGAIAAYLYEPEITEMSGGSNVPFAVLLISLVLLAIVMVLFFRNPRLGNRLLGYDAVMQDLTKEKRTGYHFSAGFKSDTGVDEKRMNTRRKSARATRRQYAKITARK